MIDGIPIPAFETLTPVGLYILLVLLLFFERVVPIGRLRAEQETTKYWRDVADTKQATIDKQAETIHILAEGTGKTVEKVMNTIQDKAGVDS
ncbi:membrane protein [Arthrobacter phage Persistence]|uniref:Membrane protein n=1 Tax=Arthrobacter phage Persistence TaxID=2836007 RepID=A0A8F3E1H0_9CAUD|nr:membrane protein [Arthrobacter phage Persistence]QWY79653.1 membrane protein [Arthrobacter phage Persistence]